MNVRAPKLGTESRGDSLGSGSAYSEKQRLVGPSLVRSLLELYVVSNKLATKVQGVGAKRLTVGELFKDGTF